MKLVYAIEVELALRQTNNQYMWKLKNLDAEKDDSEWCISRIGYADSYDEAWNQAKAFYEKYKSKTLEFDNTNKTKFNNELATFKTEVQDAFDIIINILNENLNLSLDEHTALNNINIKY